MGSGLSAGPLDRGRRSLGSEARPVPAFDTAVYPPALPLRGLAKALFFALLALGKELGQTVPNVSPDAEIEEAEGLAIMREMFAHIASTRTASKLRCPNAPRGWP